MLRKIIFIILFCTISQNCFAINEFKFKNLPNAGQFCKTLLSELNFPDYPDKKYLPLKVNTELLVEEITNIDGKSLSYDAFYTLWYYWKDPRVIEVLKKLKEYEDTDEPAYLCDYEAKTVWGEERRLFDPVMEMYNQKNLPKFSERADWVEILSNGTIQARLRFNGNFKSGNLDFRKFPFDKKTFSFELYPEFPNSIVELVLDPKMSEYEKNLYKAEGEDGLIIPDWEVKEVKAKVISYKEDKYNYSGVVVDVDAKRQVPYYIFKIMLPIFFLLVITWSVFWIYGSEIEAKVNISVVTLLALIAYNFIFDKDLPKLPYLTFLDAYILISYFFAGMATILCVYSYLRYRKYKNKINKVDHYAKYIGPLLYFVSNLSVFSYFF
jgi:hypothetical protein